MLFAAWRETTDKEEEEEANRTLPELQKSLSVDGCFVKVYLVVFSLFIVSVLVQSCTLWLQTLSSTPCAHFLKQKNRKQMNSKDSSV